MDSGQDFTISGKEDYYTVARDMVYTTDCKEKKTLLGDLPG
jgi:hypothetical protein